MNGNAQADWAVTPADRAKYIQMFSALDKNKKGYLTGSRILFGRDFFMQHVLVLFHFIYYVVKQSHQNILKCIEKTLK